MFLGMDVGTTGLKSVVISEKGEILLTHFEPYRLYSPLPGWMEQDPMDWWKAVRDSFSYVSERVGEGAKGIKAIALSGQMHSVVFLGRDGRVLRRSILWNDTRTSEQRKEIEKNIGKEILLKRVYNLPLEGFTAPKIVWLRENEPQNYSRIWKVMLPKDFINYKLTGRVVAELSDASGTALLDVVNKRWATDIIRKLGIDEAFFPPIVSSTEIVGKLGKKLAEEFGFSDGCLVVAGGADNVCGAVGSGVVSEGDALISLGSSGVVFVPTTSPGKRDRKGVIHFFNHAPDGVWYNMGVTLSAGLSLKWFRESFAKTERSYDTLLEEAASIPAGSEGLFFLPYLNGERTPYMDSCIRGAFVGISLRHSKGHFIRSVLEGVAYSLRDVVELLKKVEISIKGARITGGGAKGGLWVKIISDILKIPISRLEIEEGPAFGAAMLASVGAGYYSDVFDAVKNMVKEKDRVEPNEMDASVYEKWYKVYKKLYPALKEPMSVSFDILHQKG